MMNGTTKIICSRCHKPARIHAENGKLCIDCWRAVRKEKRELKQQDALNTCFSYTIKEKVTPKEAKIINEIMIELENKTKGL